MTPKQRELYDFVAGWIRAKGYAPSYREMSAGLRTGKSNICRLLDEIEDQGHISRHPRRKRSLEIVRRSAVELNPEVLTLTDHYASQHGISRDTAANELLRAALEAA